MRRKQSRSFDLFVFCVHCIVFAVLLGAGINVGFIIDTWFQPVFGSNPFVDFLVAVVSGGLIGGGSYGLFIKAERAIKAILKANEHDVMKWIRIGALVALIIGFVGIGISGLLYRLQFVDTPGVKYLIVIGVILEISTPLFGLILTPIQRPPVEVLEEDRVDDFSVKHVDELYDTFEEMPLDQRQRIYEGIVNENPAIIHAVLQEEVAKARATRVLQERQQQRPKRRFLTMPWQRESQPQAAYPDFPAAQTNQAGTLSQSQNGNGRR